ncbi:MAG: (Fe-S)-binding protein [Candidatus Freyarchaeota archaeon]|nr:(Fe-S)-binding protein [Candidatus Freyrarchaeum guaymaensis]
MSEKVRRMLRESMQVLLPGKGITHKLSVPEQKTLSRFEDLKYYSDLFYLCGKCGTCRYVFQDAYWMRTCPSGELRKFESYYLGGKNLLLWGLSTGKLKWSESLAEIFFHCTLCGNCVQQCQIPEIHHYALEWLQAVREEAVKNGYGMPKHLQFGRYVEEKHNPYGEPHEERVSWLKNEKLPEKAEVVYFVGCTSSYRRRNIAEATWAILKAANVDVTIASDEWCCGSPLVWTGQADIARKCAEHNINEIEKTGAEKVVTSCAGCYRMLKEVYREKFKLDYGFEVIHSPAYALELIEEGLIKLNGGEPLKVTYHDPCHIGRHMGVYEEPRRLIEKIPGVELVEMPRNRWNAWCCGAGAGVRSAFPELSSFAANERIREAEGTEAQMLTSACPFCNRNLDDAAKASGSRLKVVDLMELLASRLQR